MTRITQNNQRNNYFRKKADNPWLEIKSFNDPYKYPLRLDS